jgi:hypothetical protein
VIDLLLAADANDDVHILTEIGNCPSILNFCFTEDQSDQGSHIDEDD